MRPDPRSLLCAAALLAAVVPAAAQSAVADHEAALAALARGEVKPLDEILATVKIGTDAFIGIGFDRADGRWVYAMTLLTESGRYRVVTVDAATAEVLNEELK
ncbi:PepSY domain-containing protein [Prosthecomicrobium sp. N25]|uniref:PepSY domain-containing protein n=1 Tax=Prosthecomicrobium sp. N25 TaxID=3129254 RepID=UPI0030768BB0